MYEFSFLLFFEWKIRGLADLVTKQITALLFLSETLPGSQKCTYMDMATKIPYSSHGIHIDNMNENVQFTY